MKEQKWKLFFIVPCGKKMLWDIDPYYKGEKVAARFAYKGGLSSSAIACAQTFKHLGHAFLILSTKYGFLDPDEEIEMYREEDFIISDSLLIEQAQALDLSEIEAILVLASKEYNEKVHVAFHQCDIPIGHLWRHNPSRGDIMRYNKMLKENGQEIWKHTYTYTFLDKNEVIIKK
ncbi:MAG: hypothetical protein ACXADY_24875 [Candidatus Hodarchaeales archaeon]